MALSVCQSTEQFADVINTLIEAVDTHISEIRTQLVLAVLLSEGELDLKLKIQPRAVEKLCLFIPIIEFAHTILTHCQFGNSLKNLLEII